MILNFAQSPVLSWGTFDPDYRAVLERGITLGYTLPSFGYQLRGNRLVKMLKQFGGWTELDTLYVFATDGDSDFATINWIDPANHQITKVNSPSFTSKAGFSTNGTSSYLNTNWSPSHGPTFTQNAARFGGWIHTGGDGGATTRGLCGVSNSGATVSALLVDLGSGQVASRMNDGTNHLAGINSFANNSSYWTQRTASNSGRNVENGIQIGSFTTVSTGINSQDMYVLARNNNGTADLFGLSSWIVSIFLTGGGNFPSADLHLSLSEYMA